MKKYFIPFVACMFTGVFDDIDKAANELSAGSGESFDENENEKGKTLTFVDANGENAQISKGDALQAVYNTDGSFKGYVGVPASVVETWTPVPEVPQTTTAGEGA